MVKFDSNLVHLLSASINMNVETNTEMGPFKSWYGS